MRLIAKWAVVWMTVTSLALVGCGDSETSTDPAEGAEAAGAEEATGEEAGDEEGGETAAEEGGETAAEEGGETAAEEGGEAAGEEAGGGEAAVEEEGGESPAVFEDCVNGSDDDGDGLVDCEDPECAATGACSEGDCGDGVDNDNDGLADCDDNDCEWADACNVESCSTFYICLAELGCDCEMGVDCQFEVGDDTYGQCQTTCFQNQTCQDQCIASLSLGVQEELAAYNQCTATFCQNAQTQEEYSNCIFTNCIDEYAGCFYKGTENCDFFYFDCYNNCASGDSDCTSDCLDQLSPEGYKDLISWDDCRFTLGNTDGDDTFDSDAAVYIASFFACQFESGTCLDGALGGSETTPVGTCAEVVDCVLSCESLGDAACLDPCIIASDAEDRAPVSDIFTCGLAYCGTDEESLTPGCLAEAFMSDAEDGCAAEAAACGYAGSMEEGGEAATEEGGEAATEEGGEAATEEGGEAATEEGGEAATEEGGEAATEEGGEAATEEGGEAATEEGGEAATEEGGEAATEEGGEAATEEGGEAATEEGGEAATEEGGEAATEEGGEAATEEGGEAATEEGGEAATDEGGEA